MYINFKPAGPLYPDYFCYIHPIMRDTAYQIYSRCSSINTILYCVLFGSSLTNRAGFESDLDICIILEHALSEDEDLALRKHLLSFKLNFDVDLLILEKEKFDAMKLQLGNVYKDIYTKGLILYKRSEKND